MKVNKNVLFCHDGPLKKSRKEKYYGTAHTNEVFERYRLLGEVNVATRIELVNEDKLENLSLLDSRMLNVYEVKNFSNPKQYIQRKHEAKKKMKTIIKNMDIVIVRLPSQIGYLAFDIAKANKVPMIVEVVASPREVYKNHSNLGRLISPIEHLKLKKRIKKSYYVIYVTDQYLQSNYPTPYLSLSCSDVTIQNQNKEELTQRLTRIKGIDLDKDKIKFGSVGSISVKYKGHDYFLKVLGKLYREKMLKFEYHIAGSGNSDYLKSIAKEEGIEDFVFFHGSVNHNKIFDWLKRIDIYVQPSRTEGLPRAVIEAMSIGLPVIASNVGGIPELINSEFLFEVDELLSAFNLILSLDKKNLQRASINNFTKAKKFEISLLENKRKTFFENFIRENFEGYGYEK